MRFVCILNSIFAIRPVQILGTTFHASTDENQQHRFPRCGRPQICGILFGRMIWTLLNSAVPVHHKGDRADHRRADINQSAVVGVAPHHARPGRAGSLQYTQIKEKRPDDGLQRTAKVNWKYGGRLAAVVRNLLWSPDENRRRPSRGAA